MLIVNRQRNHNKKKTKYDMEQQQQQQQKSREIRVPLFCFLLLLLFDCARIRSNAYFVVVIMSYFASFFYYESFAGLQRRW